MHVPRLYRVILALGITTSVIAASSHPLRAEGRATARPGTRLEGLQLGQHLYGTAFDPQQHLGKVVVVNIGGG